MRIRIYIDIDLMLHIAWVLTPYISEMKIQHLAERFGYFIQRDENGQWVDAIPF